MSNSIIVRLLKGMSRLGVPIELRGPLFFLRIFTVPDNIHNYPEDGFIDALGMRLHYLDWGNRGAPPLVLVHGTRDHAHSWDFIAPKLRDRYHILAVDLRGHGMSGWNISSSYMLDDFLQDLYEFIEIMDATGCTIMAHSFGGQIAHMYAGIYPKKVSKLITIEGLGPPKSMIMNMSGKMSGIGLQKIRISETRRMHGREPKGYPTLEDAADRMRKSDPWVSDERLVQLARHATALNHDGTYRWRFDGMQKARFVWTHDWGMFEECLKATTCPTLMIAGEKSGVNLSKELRERGELVKGVRWETVPDAGHNVHVDNPEGLLAVVEDFLANS